MMYEVVAKNASASYSVVGGGAGGVAAAAAGAGFDCWPQPASNTEVTNAPKVSSLVVWVFMGCPLDAHILRNSCRVARSGRNVGQPDHILANPIMSHKAEPRPGSSEIWLAKSGPATSISPSRSAFSARMALS